MEPKGVRKHFRLSYTGLFEHGEGHTGPMPLEHLEGRIEGDTLVISIEKIEFNTSVSIILLPLFFCIFFAFVLRLLVAWLGNTIITKDLLPESGVVYQTIIIAAIIVAFVLQRAYPEINARLTRKNGYIKRDGNKLVFFSGSETTILEAQKCKIRYKTHWLLGCFPVPLVIYYFDDNERQVPFNAVMMDWFKRIDEKNPDKDAEGYSKEISDFLGLKR